MGSLRVIRDGKAELAVPLLRNYPVRVGREEDSCDVVIYDPSISRVHARIFFENGSFYIEDLESRYGTYVNNTRITMQTPLTENAQIMIGSTILQFHSSANGNAQSVQATGESMVAANDMQCPNALCGSAISSRFKFCPHCGAYLPAS